MPTADQKDFIVDNGLDANESIKIGTQTVTSLVDSAQVSTIAREPANASAIALAGGASSKAYDSAELLPTSGNDSGDFGYVASTNRLYLWNGSGWYNIALVNTSPTVSTSPDSNYTIDGSGGAAVTVTMLAVDPEGTNITYTQTSETATNFVNITQDSGVFTLTPLTKAQADSNGVGGGGTFSVTFKATDGVNIVPRVSSFTITWIINYNWLQATQQAQLSPSNPASGGNFGFDVDLDEDGNTAAVGARSLRSSHGSVYVYTRDGTSWSQFTELQASDQNSTDQGRLGYSVAISKDGKYVVGGAPYARYSNANYGKAYVYKEPAQNYEFLNNTLSNRRTDHNFSQYGELDNISALDFSSDGSYVFIYGYDGSGGAASKADRVLRYPLSTAYDITTTSNSGVQVLDVAGQSTDGSGSAAATEAWAMKVGKAGTRVYLIDNATDTVYQWNLSTADDLTSASYGTSFSVAGKETTPKGIDFKPDGTKMYIAGETTKTVHEYNLSTAWEVNTASFNQSQSYATAMSGSSVATGTNLLQNARGIAFNNDGTRLYIIDDGANLVWRFNLSTAYDISSSTYTKWDPSNGSNLIGYASLNNVIHADMKWNPTGSIMSTASTNQDKIYQWGTVGAWSEISNLEADSTIRQNDDLMGWSVDIDKDGTRIIVGAKRHNTPSRTDCGGAYVFKNNGSDSYAQEAFLLASDANSYSAEAGESVALNSSDGSVAVVGASYHNGGGSSRGAVYVYDRTGTTWSQTSTLQPNDAGNADQFGWRVDIDKDGRTLIASSPWDDDKGSNAGAVYVFTKSTGTAGPLSNAAFVHRSAQTYSAGMSGDANANSPYTLNFKPDGTKAYIADSNTDLIYQYSLSTPYDVTDASMSYDNVSFNLRTSMGNTMEAHSMKFKPDGTKLYVLKHDTDTVYEYDLSTAYDLSTISYNSVTLAIGSVEGFPEGIFFKPDGTKMYVTGTQYDSVRMIDLGTAWNVSTGTYNSSNTFSVSSQDVEPMEVIFNSSGTKMYVLGGATRAIYSYTLSTAWDVTTASYDSQSYSIASGTDVNMSHSRSIALSADTTANKLFVIGTNRDDICRVDMGIDYWVQEAKLTPPFTADSQKQNFGHAISIDDRGTKISVSTKKYNEYGGSSGNEAGISYIYRKVGSTWYYTKALQASNIGGSDKFGGANSLSGDGGYLIVGAFEEDTGSSNAGSSYIFSAPVISSGTTITQYLTTETRIQHSDVGTNQDYFGRAIALDTDGNTAIVSASHEDTDAGNAGRCYIFVKSDAGTWSEQYDFGSGVTQANSYFGLSGVSISGDGNVALAGKPSQDSGRVAIHTRSGTSWSSYGALTGEVNDGKFGSSCAISGDGTTIAIGAEKQSGSSSGSTGQGAAYIYVKNNSNVWTLQQKINPNSTSGQGSGDQNFGQSITISNDGNTVAIGAPGVSSSGSVQGRVEVWTRSGTTWTHQQTAVPSSRGSRDTFGWRCALSGTDGNTLVVGQLYESSTYAGYAWIFTRSGTTWSQETTLRGSDTANADHFGSAVAISNDGTKVLVGAERDTLSSGHDAGSAYLFVKSGSTWSQEIKYEPSSPSYADQFGYAVGLSKDASTIMVGAMKEDTGATDAGSVYIYSAVTESY